MGYVNLVSLVCDTGGDAVVTRCLWRAGIGITDTGTAMEGPHQPVTRLEWWNFTAMSPADFDSHSDFDLSWLRYCLFVCASSPQCDMSAEEFPFMNSRQVLLCWQFLDPGVIWASRRSPTSECGDTKTTAIIDFASMRCSV